MLAGRYRVGALLGRGSSACVLDGYDTRLERPVAIKRLRPDAAAIGATRPRFELEVRAAARLTHPNAVAVYDAGEDGGRTYLVMERLDGGTLADRIAQGRLRPAEAARVGADVLAALRAAHALGMVHRNIKPSNILFGEEGQAKVADFGIASGARGDSAGAAPASGDAVFGHVGGAPAYLAPERLANRPATARSDLFALGVVLFEAVAGRRPEPAPASVPGAPPVLAAVVLRALAPRPEDRYPSAAEMAVDLRSALVAITPDSAPASAGYASTA